MQRLPTLLRWQAIRSGALRRVTGACLALACSVSTAQTPAPAVPPQPANEQVIVPQVDRRDVRLPRFPSKDFELGLLGGTFATQNFGTPGLAG